MTASTLLYRYLRRNGPVDWGGCTVCAAACEVRIVWCSRSERIATDDECERILGALVARRP